MMGLMAAASIGAAPLYFLAKAMQDNGGRHDNLSHAIGVIYLTAGPVLAVLLIAGGIALLQSFNRKR
jgi:hypothetical protein